MMILNNSTPPPPVTSDDDFEKLGRWVIERYERPFCVKEESGIVRDITGFEMAALHRASRVLAEERRERDGCCGDGPDQEGRCAGCGGWCERVTEAATAEAFCTNFIKWLEPKENNHVNDDRNEATSGGRIARKSSQPQANYDPADDLS